MVNTCGKNQGNRGGSCISGMSVLQKMTLKVLQVIKNDDDVIETNGDDVINFSSYDLKYRSYSDGPSPPPPPPPRSLRVMKKPGPIWVKLLKSGPASVRNIVQRKGRTIIFP